MHRLVSLGHLFLLRCLRWLIGILYYTKGFAKSEKGLRNFVGTLEEAVCVVAGLWNQLSISHAEDAKILQGDHMYIN